MKPTTTIMAMLAAMALSSPVWADGSHGDGHETQRAEEAMHCDSDAHVDGMDHGEDMPEECVEQMSDQMDDHMDEHMGHGDDNHEEEADDHDQTGSSSHDH